jgi:hypothetical protein
VATGTIGPARAFVHIILSVAAIAILRQPFPALAGMACQAAKAPVRSHQTEASLRMVKWQWLLPVKDCVTGLAIFAEPPKMRILLSVAIGTGRVQAAVMRVVPVAPGACGFCVPANQGIIGQLMIEAVAIKACQLRASSVMLAVTDFARLASRV